MFPVVDRATQATLEAIAEDTMGPLHPNVGTLLESAGGNLRGLGEIDAAADLLARADDLRTVDTARLLPLRLAYISATLSRVTPTRSAHA